MAKRFYKITEVNTDAQRVLLEKKLESGHFTRLPEFENYLSDILSSIVFKMDSKTDIFLINQILLDKMISMSKVTGYNMIIEDITDDLFYNKVNIPNSVKDEINDYLFNLFSVDDVLDKINEGIELTEVDKLILQKKV